MDGLLYCREYFVYSGGHGGREEGIHMDSTLKKVLLPTLSNPRRPNLIRMVIHFLKHLPTP